MFFYYKTSTLFNIDTTNCVWSIGTKDSFVVYIYINII